MCDISIGFFDGLYVLKIIYKTGCGSLLLTSEFIVWFRVSPDSPLQDGGKPFW